MTTATGTVSDWGQAIMTSATAALVLFLAAILKVLGFLVILLVDWLIASLL
jgi:hypothetical protein